MKKTSLFHGAIAFCIALLPLSTAWSATYDWTGATDGNMTGTPANWGGTEPAGADTAQWNAASYTNAPTANGNMTIGELLFTASNTGNVTFGAGTGTLTLNGIGGIGIQLDSGSGAVSTGGAKFALGGDQSWINDSANTLTVAGTITNSGNTTAYTLTAGGTGNTTLSGIISNGGTVGTTALTKNGTGTLTVSGANTFTGATLISGGTLVAGNNAALGSNTVGTTVASGATLDVNGQNLGTEIVTISGAGVGGAGAIINSGADQANALGRIVLAADATIGGAKRWDLRNSTPTLDMAGFTLTKTGVNYIAFVGANLTTTGNIVINQGELNLTLGTKLNGTAANSVTVNNGGTLGMYQSSSAHDWTLNLNEGSILRGENSSNATTQNIWAGPVSASGNVTVNAQATLSINGTISGTANLTKNGTATLNLRGTNSFNGTTTVNAGTLALDYATNNTSKLDDASALLLGGTLSLSGGSHAEVVASTTLIAGTASTVTRPSGTSTLQMGMITNNPGSTINFVGNSTATTTTPTTNGILGAWATVDGTNWAATDGGNNVVAFTGYTATSAAGDVAANYTNNNLSVNSTQTLDGPATPNSFAFNTAGSYTITLTGANTLTAGGILVNAGVGNNTSTITGGTIQMPAATDLIVTQNNSSGTLTGTVIGSSILDNSGTGLIKKGAGVVTLGASNTYTGNTTIAAGAVVAAANDALGTSAGSTTVASGAVFGLSGGIDYSTKETIIGSGVGTTAAVGSLVAVQRGFVQSVSGNNTFAGDIQISAAGISRIGLQTGAQLTLGGNITMAPGVTGVRVLFRAGDTAGDFITLTNNGNSWDTNTLIFSANATVGGAGVRLGIDNALSTVAALEGGGSAGAGNTFDLAGFNQTVAGLGTLGDGNGPLKISNSAGNATTSTLTLNLSANQTTANTVITDGTLGGKVAVVKTGAFNQTLAGASTYTGGTTIKNGSLILSGGANRIVANGTVTLGDVATTGKLVLGTTTSVANQTLSSLTTTGLGGSVVGGNATAGSSVLTMNVASGSTAFDGTLGGAGTNENNLVIAKSGAGTLALSGTNTYTGTTTVSAGILQAGSVGALGASGSFANRAVITTGGTLELATDTSVAAEWLDIGSNNTGTVVVNRATAGAGITQSLGTQYLGSNAALNVTQGANVTSGTATLGLASLIMSGGATGNATFNPTTAAVSITGSVNSGVAFAKTLVLDGTNANNAISGNISNGSGTVSLRKSNSSTWVLSGVNTYTGNTTVSAGTLLISSGGSLAAASPVAVTGGVFGGAGTVAGNVSVSSGATLVAGVSLADDATFNLTGNLTASSGSIVSLGLSAAGSHDTLNLAGASYAFDANQTFAFLDQGAEVGLYSGIITTPASFSQSVAGWTVSNPGWTGTFTVNGNNVDFNLTAVPEPGTWIMVGIGLAFLLYRKPRRRLDP